MYVADDMTLDELRYQLDAVEEIRERDKELLL
jgi:hypothetical protein